MTFKAFVFCLFGHSRTNARTAKGDLVLKCVDCGDELPVLQSEIVIGPKAKPDRVHGERLETAKIVKGGKVVGRIGG